MQKTKITFGFLGLLALWLSACAGPAPAATSIPTQAPTPTSVIPAPDCAEKGTIGNDRVPNPTQGFDRIGFAYYLPPCYENLTNQSFPVLYLITLGYESQLSPTDNTPMSLAERLIHSGKLPPVIIIVPDQLIGYGSDAALTKDLVPYIDSKFRTIPDRTHRGVGGISNGAAIAARMAFQFPETFGSVGLLSGGLADGEQERFEGWVTRTSSGQWPRVRIDVGDQDAIMRLTQNLLTILDKHQIPYMLNVVPGGTHSWGFWSGQMESYLLWLASDW